MCCKKILCTCTQNTKSKIVKLTITFAYLMQITKDISQIFNRLIFDNQVSPTAVTTNNYIIIHQVYSLLATKYCYYRKLNLHYFTS